LVDETAVALEVLLVDIEAGDDPKKSLESRHAHNMAGGRLVRLQGGIIMATVSSPQDAGRRPASP
jgi:hypothetical protein